MLGRNVRHKNLDGRRIVVTLAGLLCLLGLTGLLTGRTGFRAAGRRLEVAFRDAHGLRTGSAVRIAGLDVGRVVDVGLTERDRSPRALIVIALPPVLVDRLRQDVQLAIEEGRDGQSRIKILSTGQSDASLAPGQVVQGVEWSAWDGLADQLGLAPGDLSPWRPLLEELRLALAARTAQKEASAQSTETLASQDSPPAEPASPAAEPAALPSPSPAPAPEPVVVAEPPPAPAAQLPVVVAAEPPAPAPDAGPAPAPEPRPITWGALNAAAERHEAQPAPLPPAVTNNAMPLPLADATATPAPATVAAPTQYPVETPTPNPARPWLFVDAVQLAPTPVASAEPKPVALETVDPGDRKYDTRPDPLVANVGGDPAPDRAATAPGAPIDLERITPPDPIVMSVASSGLSAPSQSEPVNCAECRALGHGVEMVAPAERPLRDEAVQQAQVPSDLAPPPARTPPTPTYPAPAPPPAATPSPAPTPTPSPAPTPTPSPAPTPTPPRPDTAGPPPTTTTAPTPTPSPSPEPATAAPSTATPSAPATAQPSTPTAAAPSATTPSGPSPAEDYAQISAANLSAEAAAAGLGFSDAPVMIGDQAPFSIRQALSPTPPTPPHPPVPPVPGQHPKSAIFVPWARGFKIADNQSPRPQDRFFYSFDYFNNLNGSINSRIGADVSHIKIYRELIGVEKTFLDGNASIGLRMPINTLTADSPLKGLGGTNTAVGNLTVFSKLILWQDQKGRNLVSGGLAVTVPNGPTSFAGSPSVNGFHDAQIQPFIGYIFANDNWFVQGFEAIDVPTDPNDVTAMYNDLGIGYFLYRNKDPNALISMIAPTFETHVNVPLNHVGFRLNDPAGTPNVVDLTYGVNILLRRSAMLTLGFVDPVTGPRPFSYEWQLLLNVYFGRTRARGAQVTPTPPLGGN